MTGVNGCWKNNTLSSLEEGIMMKVLKLFYTTGTLLLADQNVEMYNKMNKLSMRHQMDRVKRIWYLSPMRAAKVQASLRIRAVSPEPLLAHTSSDQEEPSDRKPDPWPLWMAGHAQLKFVMSEQRRFRRACASAQSRQNLRCSLIQAVIKKNLQTESQIPGPSEWLGMRS